MRFARDCFGSDGLGHFSSSLRKGRLHMPSSIAHFDHSLESSLLLYHFKIMLYKTSAFYALWQASDLFPKGGKAACEYRADWDLQGIITLRRTCCICCIRRMASLESSSISLGLGASPVCNGTSIRPALGLLFCHSLQAQLSTHDSETDSQ
jgi:hypothetical protein